MGQEVPPTPVPTPANTILLQAFEWNVPADKKHFKRLLLHIEQLRDWGVNTLWIPPACKAASPEGNGYDCYDLYDLGEFDQKGTTATKWGSKEELIALGEKAKELKMGLYWDAVLNHKAGADDKEKCKAQEVDQNDRNEKVSEVYEINGWLKFDFNGRKDKYSKQKYHWYHFTGTDYNADNDKKAIYKICGDGKGWSDHVSNEQGNGDFLMFADLDYEHHEVVDDVTKWGHWILKEVPALCGFRMDAVQHFSEKFTDKWVEGIREEFGKDIFFVGEYFSPDVKQLQNWLDKMHRKFCLFDAPLMYNLSKLSTTADSDMRKVFDKTLVQEQPTSAVTFVTNHDTQPGQTVETPIEGFFKPLAYALILLRREGYPCVFYGDLYGTKGDKAEPPSCGGKLAHIMLARTLYAYGEQDDYWDQENCIGFVRRGTHDFPAGLACVMSNTGAAEKQMHVGREHKGEIWTDVLGWSQGEVTINEAGNGVFPTSAASMAIFVNTNAAGREKFERKFDDDIYKI